ncbi:hypothetical protein FA15DRAFT_102283 [Coprinopsis marcescibilis]|uniref:Uncharacterized protein n=1 Tax=Coprinopsis marcescibilis TaxID=230819 RepID=A0A5C3KLT6_COPMA|nr:hypothetical protein FA15DRAFT_102283 [Coprinopsis marcescibilis]
MSFTGRGGGLKWALWNVGLLWFGSGRTRITLVARLRPRRVLARSASCLFLFLFSDIHYDCSLPFHSLPELFLPYTACSRFLLLKLWRRRNVCMSVGKSRGAHSILVHDYSLLRSGLVVRSSALGTFVVTTTYY